MGIDYIMISLKFCVTKHVVWQIQNWLMDFIYCYR